jgi:hypothetical protein
MVTALPLPGFCLVILLGVLGAALAPLAVTSRFAPSARRGFTSPSQARPSAAGERAGLDRTVP